MPTKKSIKKIFLCLLLIAAGLFVAGCGDSQSGEDAAGVVSKDAKPLDINKSYSIVFSGVDNESEEIIITKPDGTGRRTLTNNLNKDLRPRPCLKQNFLLFISDFDKQLEIYYSNYQGKQKRNITRNGFHDDVPALTPDCKTVIYQSERGDGNMELFEIGVDGKNGKRLTNNKIKDVGPFSMSPDGRYIAYRQEVRTPIPHVTGVILDRTTLKQRKLTKLTVEEGPPRWSPDGKYLIFSALENFEWHLYKVLPNGTGLTRIDNPETTNEYEPSISPDSKSIAFIGTQLGKFDIWITNPDGKKFTRVTDNVYAKTNVQFSPDSKFIAYNERDNNQRYNIIVSTLDGKKKFQVTKTFGDDNDPQWIIE